MMWSIGSSNIRIRNNHSLTLIELLVVIIVIGIIISLNAPRFKDSINNARFDDFSNRLFYRMEYLKERACVEQKIYRLEFNLGNRVINIEAKEEDSEVFKPVMGVLGRGINIPEGIEVEVAEQFIIFYPDATIQGGYILISDYQNKASIIIKETTGNMEFKKI